MWTTTQLGLILVLCIVLASAMQVKEVRIETFQLSPGSEDILTLETTIEQLNSTAFAIAAHYVQKVELDNSYTVQIIFSIGPGGDNFMEIYRTDPEGVCDFIKSDASDLQADIHSEIDECPIPPGEFSLEREVINLDSLLDLGIAGKFKADVVLSQEGDEKVRLTMIMEAM